MPAYFPSGIIINVSAVILGGIAGALLGPKLPKDLRTTLNLIRCLLHDDGHFLYR
ncbi:hypothetical protein [Collinsella tanakaei]|uniref:hypothetical protein n=1 Tax=Collinsella tanakaei TaxID=626935 RepID=UPI00216ACFD7|nr:hypothetical protein [Collinsella tanakaei]